MRKFQNTKYILLVFTAFAAIPVIAQTGGDYDLSWSTIDGGGGTSSGGNYVLSGTIGQPDAGRMAGGEYELTSGFWFGSGCIVDFEDLLNFVTDWLNPGDVDANLDGQNGVNLEDFSILTNYWLDRCPDNWPL